MDRVAVYAGTRNLYYDMVVSAKSLLYHNGADRVVFLIEDDDFPDILPDCVSTINVANQSFFPPSGPNFKSRWSYMVLMRTALTKLFPDLDRILSLDHDTIICKPIDLVWHIDLGNDYYFAAVEEKQIQHRPHPYYNFGVVLHNLALLRTGMDNIIIDEINTTHHTYCEQDAVNALCSPRILELPPQYNTMCFNVPKLPDECAAIRHYATRNNNMRALDEYKLYDRLSWYQVIDHKVNGTPQVVPSTRHDIINAFIKQRNFHSFLEIGTDTGASLRRVKADTIVSVDPDQSTPATIHATSDDFFASHDETFDIIFIDGLHECNQVYRDIMNAVQHITPGGVIVLHDCLPTSERMQIHSDKYPGGEWTGDVWKAFVSARSKLPYLMYTIDTDYGCGIIDTSVGIPIRTDLPSDMNTMTYNQFVQNRDNWMNVKGAIING